MMEADDRALLRLIGKGDRRAFEAFYARNAPWLALRLRRRCRDAELADEMLQETFLTVWRAAGSYRGDGEVVGWLWSIAARRLVDTIRRARVRPQTVDTPDDTQLAWSPSAEEEAMAGAYDARLEQALRRLSPELRAVLQATVLDGLTVREAALMLGLPEGTVKTRAMRARRELKAALS
ncbi:RNA polymerase sigma factor [Dactylosporangium sp. NPDC051485]|uniref:RNA polymerase sigma factor n=1 Tax=Dactylosporangium sp. NPDC051485 TaxID=3154846 RepID=UPI0034239B94